LRVALIIHSLGAGGAERVATVMADGFARDGHDVLVLTSQPPEDDLYPLSESVRRSWFGPFPRRGVIRRAWNNLVRLRRIRRSMLTFGPDVVISFMGVTNVRVLVALLATGIPVIVTEHTDPKSQPAPMPFRLAGRASYRWCSFLVSASHGVDSQFPWIPQVRRRVIPNPLPLDIDDMRGASPEWRPPRDTKVIVSMGRLRRFKGFDVLVEAFSKVSGDYAEWDLVILGEGPERLSLEAKVSGLGLVDRVHLPGNQGNPFAILEQCDVFALASRFEGFGNVIVEAMACGLPVVVTDCESGPRDIIIDGDNGLLVPVDDPNRLAEGLKRLMDSEELRRRLSTRGAEHAARYRAEVILGEWYRLFYTLTEPERG
jgi:glycosyltransferase involved in cell wall biosynthesis